MKNIFFTLFLSFHSLLLFSQKIDIEQFRGSFKELISKAKQENKKILIVFDRNYQTPNDTLNSSDKDFIKAHFYENNLPIIYKINSFWGEAVNLWQLYKWDFNAVVIYTDSNGNPLEIADISNYNLSSGLKFELHYKTPKSDIQNQLSSLAEIRVNNETIKIYEQAYTENKSVVSIKNLLKAKNYLRIKDCELANEFFDLLTEEERLKDENFIILVRNFCSIDTKIGNFLLKNTEKVKYEHFGIITFWKEDLIEKAAKLNDVSMAEKASNDHARLTSLSTKFTENLKFWDLFNFYIKSKDEIGLNSFAIKYAQKVIKNTPHNYKSDFQYSENPILELNSIIHTLLIASNDKTTLKEAIKWSFFVEKHTKKPYTNYILELRAKLYYKIGERDKAIKTYENLILSEENMILFEKMKRGENIIFTEND